MRLPKPILILLIIFLLPHDLQAQKYQASDFVETQLPKPNSEEWRQFLDGAYDFKVSIKKHELNLKYWDSNDRDWVIILFTDHGRIVGTDNGEFGGELEFFDDSDNGTVIKKGNIRYLFEYKHEIYFMESLYDYKGMDESFFNNYKGILFKLAWKGNGYTSQKILDFDEEPGGMFILNGDILVTTWNYLYRIHNLQKEVIFDLQKEGIFKNVLNQEIFFNSVAATDEHHVYTGTRAGYLQFDLTNKSYKYYKYKNNLFHLSRERLLNLTSKRRTLSG
jgi:hypothetical protein